MVLPIPDIDIDTSSSVDPLMDFFRKMGVAEDDDFKPFKELTMGKDPKGRRRGKSDTDMKFLVTPVVQLPGNPAGKAGPRKMNEMIGQPVF